MSVGRPRRRFGVLFANQTDNGGEGREERMKGRQADRQSDESPGGPARARVTWGRSHHDAPPPCSKAKRRERKSLLSAKTILSNIAGFEGTEKHGIDQASYICFLNKMGQKFWTVREVKT